MCLTVEMAALEVLRLKRFLLLERCSSSPVSPTVYHPHPNPQGGSSSADSWLRPDSLNQSLWGLGARGPHLRGAPTLGPPAPEASPPAWRALPPSSPAAKPGPQRGAGTGLGGKTSPASSSGTPGCGEAQCLRTEGPAAGSGNKTRKDTRCGAQGTEPLLVRDQAAFSCIRPQIFTKC